MKLRTGAVNFKCPKRIPRRGALGFDTTEGTLVVGHMQDRWDRRTADGRLPSESVRQQSHKKLYCYCTHTTEHKLQLLAPGRKSRREQSKHRYSN